MIKKFIIALLIATTSMLGACRTTLPNSGNGGAIGSVRQKLEELPEPTFESLEVYTHDLSARGVGLLIERYPDTKVPLRIFADSALSLLEKQGATMLDLVALSDSLDQIKQGKVKIYLDIAWTILELNGVIRRDDLSASLTVREQRLVIALCNGIKLGTDPTSDREKVLNGFGPRYGPATK